MKNREIKFRAFDKSDCVMYETIPFEDMLKMEIMQYTGLKDKNGVEIYEGDILAHEGLYGTKHQMLFVMEWDNERARFSDYSPKKEFIVIGNIYQNAELLK